MMTEAEELVLILLLAMVIFDSFIVGLLFRSADTTLWFSCCCRNGREYKLKEPKNK